MDWSIVKSIVYAAFLLAAGWVASAPAGGAVGALLARTGLDPLVRNLLRSAVRPLVLLIAAVAALEVVGANAGGLLAVLAGGAVAVGLGLKGSLSNVASGALLLSIRPFNIGDQVELGGVIGIVRSLGLFTVTLECADGQFVTLVNDRVLQAPIRNHTRKGERLVEVELLVARSGGIDAPVEAAVVIAGQDARISRTPPPVVEVLDATATHVRLVVRAWAPSTAHAAVAADLRRRLLAIPPG